MLMIWVAESSYSASMFASVCPAMLRCRATCRSESTPPAEVQTLGREVRAKLRPGDLRNLSACARLRIDLDHRHSAEHRGRSEAYRGMLERRPRPARWGNR